MKSLGRTLSTYWYSCCLFFKLTIPPCFAIQTGLLEEQFFNEAPANWNRYNQFLAETSLEIRYDSRDDDGAIDNTLLRKVIRRGAEIAVYSFANDGTEEVNAINDEYAFRVKKKAGQPYVMDRLKDRDQVATMADIGYSVMNSKRVTNPTWLYREPLEDIIRRPYFELKTIEKATLDGFDNLAVIDFEYRHPYEPSSDKKPFNWVQGGRLWLDMDNSWVIVRFVGDLIEPPNEILRDEVVWEYAEGSGSFRRPTRMTRYRLSQDDSRNTDFSTYSFTFDPPSFRPPRKQFRLTYFGFDEPAQSTYGKSAWPLVATGVGIGLVCLFVAFVFRRSIRKT